MTKYKVLKNFPVFTTENKIFRNAKVGDKGFVPGNDFVAQNLIENGYIEEIPEEEEYKRWRACDGDEYWFVGDKTGVCYCQESRYSSDSYRYNTGNYFATEKEAQAKLDYDIALQTVKDDAKGFKPDWSDNHQAKYRIYYDNVISDNFCIAKTWQIQVQAPVLYFRTKEDANNSLKLHEKEWRILAGLEGK